MAKTNAQIIAAVERWQATSVLYPFLCKTDRAHRKLVAAEVDARVILACPDCDYRTDVPWVVNQG